MTFRTESLHRRRSLPLALAVLLAATLLGARPSTADPCLPESTESLCAFLVANSLPFLAPRENVIEGENGSFRVAGEFEIDLPLEPIPLFEADAEFIELEDGTIWLTQAYVRLPIKSLPGIDLPEEVYDNAPFVFMGLADRSELQELMVDPNDPNKVLPLPENEDPANPGEILDPTFLFFQTAGGTDLSLPLPLPAEVTGGAPAMIPLSQKQVITFILDPSDPFVYLANLGHDGLLQKMERKQRKAAQKKLKKQAKADRKAQKKAEREQRKLDKKNGVKPTKEQKKQAKKDKKSKKKKSKKDRRLPRGAFAYSHMGGIPFAPVEAPQQVLDLLSDLEGHLYVRGPTPMGPFAVLDGSTLTGIFPDGFSMAGFGEAAISLPPMGPFQGFELPLGSTFAALEITGDEQEFTFSGIADPSTSFLPEEIPVGIDAYLDVSGTLSTDVRRNAVSAKGYFALDTKGLGKASGAKLAGLDVEGELSIDTRGFALTGTTTAALHPAIGASGAISVAYVAQGGPEDWYVRLEGQLAVDGISLGANAMLLVDARGVYVAGEFTTGLVQIQLEGEIGQRGPVLTGSATVQFSADSARADALSAVSSAQAEVRRLDQAIDAMREQVKDERRNDSANWRAAKRDLDAAQTKVDGIRNDIDKEKARRKADQDDLDDVCSGTSGAVRAGCLAANSIKIAGLAAKVAGHTANIVALEAALATAKAALTAAKAVVTGIEAVILAAPVDVDPRIVALFASRDIALLALGEAERLLDSVPSIPGTVTAQISLTLDRHGLSGDVSATASGLQIGAASLDLGAQPKVCVAIIGGGELCTPF